MTKWYVTAEPRDIYTPEDLDRYRELRIWTLSRDPEETGWETDSGYDGYGLTYADAREFADAANERSTYQWHPISTAPLDGTPVLLSLESDDNSHWGIWVAAWNVHNLCWDDGISAWLSETDENPTHWMPLPPEPAK